MSAKVRLKLFAFLYLASFTVLTGWLILILVGLFVPSVMMFANEIALPTVLGSVACVTVFKTLAARAERQVSA